MTIEQWVGLYLILLGIVALLLCRNFHLNKDPANDDKDFHPPA